MLQAQPEPAKIAYVQPTQVPDLSAPCKKAEATLAEVTNLLTRQKIVAMADGAPCCYRENGKAYSSVYKNDACKRDVSLLCFRQTMFRLMSQARRRET